MFDARELLLISGTAMQFGAISAMVLRRLHRQLPFFFAYLSFNCVRTVFLWLLHPITSTAYAYAYWGGELVGVCLGFLVIAEIYREVLRPYSAVHHLAKVLIKWAAIVLSGVAVITTSLLIAGHFPLFTTLVLRFELVVAILQCGMMAFLFLFASSLGLRWNDVVMGIAVGVFILSLIGILSVTVADTFKENLLYALCRQGAYDSALLVWIVYLVRKKLTIKVEMPDFGPLRAWNELLEEFASR